MHARALGLVSLLPAVLGFSLLCSRRAPARAQTNAPDSPALGHLRVTVREARNHKPVRGADIILHGGALAREDIILRSDDQGSAISPPLEPGAWQATIDVITFETDARPVTVTADTTADVQVLLRKKTLSTGTSRIFVERSDNLVGIADSATQGTVGARELRQRPLLRPGELLEAVPGVIITQHSGSGKANQYFLRGFNLDHGTDLATFLDGMPVNMPTHAHGQGYTDLNFLIPELVSGMEYRKGSYSAEQGDFSSAGSIDITYANRLRPGTAGLSEGNFGERRLLLAGSPETAPGNLVYGLELFHYDGPWVRGDDYRKVNGVLRYSQGGDRDRFSITGMGHDGAWNSTDQVARRALDEGKISRFGVLDPTDGGKSHRYSLSGQLQRRSRKEQTRASAYVIDYKLNLFSDFTYFLDHPETNPPGTRGDQFEQADNRTVYGVQAAHQWFGEPGKLPSENTLGFQLRHDNIRPVGLYDTEARQRFRTVRQDRVKENSLAPYFENRVQWSPHFRTTAGVRWDFYSFDVSSSIAENSGKTHANIVSPKLSFVLGPWSSRELYLNLARGFHSNDARGATITLDPTTREHAERVTPLVRSREAEIGFRTSSVRHLQSTLSLWYLHLDSELLFTGDAGTTVAGRPSRRTGVEWTNYYTPSRTLTIDADYAYSRARFTDQDPVGERIPGAIEGAADFGVSVEPPSGAFGGVRLRYFGPRPLIEDNSVRSRSSALVYARLGYKLRGGARMALDVFNLFNARVSDIDYYYASRLPGEPAEGVNDIHTHPAESRSVRFALMRDF